MCMYPSERIHLRIQDMVKKTRFFGENIWQSEGDLLWILGSKPLLLVCAWMDSDSKSYHIPQYKARNFAIVLRAQACSLRWQFSNLHQ